VADRPHRDSAVGDPDWFARTPRERTDGRPQRTQLPRRRGQQPVQPASRQPSRQAPPEPGRADPAHLTGRQPAPRPYTTGSTQAPARYSTSQQRPERSTGRQQAAHRDRQQSGSQPTGQRQPAGTRQPQKDHGTGQQPPVRRRATGPQPAVERAARKRPPETTGSYTPDPRYTTGPHPVTGSHPTGGWPNDQRYATGPQPWDPRSTGAQPHVERHDTGQHAYVERYPGGQSTFGANTFGQHPDAGAERPARSAAPQPAAETPAPGWAARDPRWATGPQPAEFVRALQSQRHAGWDTTGEPHTGEWHQTGGYPGQYPDSQYGQHPDGQYPNGQYPNGQYPDGQYLAEQHPDGQYVADEYDPAQHAGGPPNGGPRRPARDPNAARTRLREKKARQRQRAAVITKVSAAALAVTVLLVTGFTWGAKKWLDVRFRQVSALDLGSSAIVNPAAQHGDDNFLVIGLDARPGAEDEDPAGGARSDLAMVVHVPQDRGRVVAVSFPRTLLVDRPACEGWDQDGGRYTGQQDPGQPKSRISTAYRAGGPRCVTRVVQQLSGLAINHFVSIDFAGFRSMVDAVGGVQVCVEQPVRDGVLGDVVPAPGTARLGGEQALSFVRASHLAEDPSGESGRVLRQQQLLAAVARAAVTGGTLAHPGRLIDALADNTFVDNVDADQLQALAGALTGMDPGKVTFATVPAGEPDADGNQALRAEDATALFSALINGAPLAGEQPAASAPPPAAEPQPATVPPAEIKLQVQNATGEDGLATQIAKRLRAVGFDVVQMGNAEHTDHTVIRFSAAREGHARSVAAAVPRAALQLDPTMGGAIQVVIGSDFDGVIQAVQLGQPVPGQPVQPAPAGPAAALHTIDAAEAGCG